jgi:hypothetical protein
VKVGKGERVVRVEPAVLGVASIFGVSNGEHASK